MTFNRESIAKNSKAAFYAAILPELKIKAAECGWALGLHGSLESDMDLMAMPWTCMATSADVMINKLNECFSCSDPNYDFPVKKYEHEKPNNRVVYTISIWADLYLDINIISTYHKLLDISISGFYLYINNPKQILSQDELNIIYDNLISCIPSFSDYVSQDIINDSVKYSLKVLNPKSSDSRYSILTTTRTSKSPESIESFDDEDKKELLNLLRVNMNELVFHTFDGNIHEFVIKLKNNDYGFEWDNQSNI